MLTAAVNEPVRASFLVTDLDGITPWTGLVNGDFVKVLLLGGAVDPGVVAVTEIGSGYYYAEFTPDTIGLWYLAVTAPSEDVFVFDVQVGEYEIHDSLSMLRKTAVNRLEVDLGAQELVLYDDDGTSVLQRWPLETNAGGGDLVTTQPGVQTKRKPPLL
jgi:hypothetical protein